jgi:site-specific DNA recombinase
MDRPALQRLLHDAQNGKFDTVIVYKVDRLTRSLRDFTKIIEVLDTAGASFVSVTQQFNTSSSMGRLTLNVLLSFAQFEREIISERTRDKMSAAAKKGKWQGGYPVLGYDIDFENKVLVVNEKEVPIIESIFKTYLETKSSAKTAHALNDKGYTAKEWTTKEGIKRGGAKFNESNIRKYLKNPIYLGIIRYKDESYKGRHPALIDERTFELVQSLMAKNRVQNKSQNRDKHEFILRGLLRCSCCGSFMTPSFSYSKGRKYYYYRCTKVTHLDRTACKIRIAPARETEKLIIDRLRVLSENRVLIDKIIQKAKIQTSEALPLLRKELNGKTGELRRIEGESSNLLNALSSAGQDLKKNKLILRRLDELEDKEHAIEARIQEIKLSIEKLHEQAINADVIQRNFGIFSRVFGELTIIEKRELLQLLIKDIQYDPDHSKIRMALRPLPDIGPFIVNNQDKSCEPACSRLPG